MSKNLESENINVLFQMYNNLSDKEKELFLTKINDTNSEEESYVLSESDIVKECPYCHSKHFVKNGHKNGHQRYLCHDCHKTFSSTVNTILYHTRKPLSTWRLYIKCMMNKLPLRACARECGIDLTTAFYWRHKILDALQNMMNSVTLDGVVEADETFTRISYKGNHSKGSNFKMPRRARCRGNELSTRGISREQVCIPCVVNLNGCSISKIANLGRPNLRALQFVMDGRITKGSVFVTDSLRPYQKVALDMDLTHVRIPRNKHSNGTFNIQKINSYHGEFKSLVMGRCKGVSTKHLNNYLVYHNFVNYAKESFEEKEVILFNFIRSTKCMSKSVDITRRNPLPIAC